MGQKIIIIGSAHPFRGGLASYNERLARALIEAGNEVVIQTFSLQYPGILFPGKSQYSDSPSPKGLTIKRSLNSINPFNWIVVGRKLKKEKPDLVIIKYWIPFMAPCFGVVARIIRSNKHSKVISILDNIIPHEKRFGDKWLSKYFTKSVDGFIAMSESVLSDLEKFDNKKPRKFNPHPVFDNFGPALSKVEARKKLNIPDNIPLILFFGFIRDYKGLDLLLDALSIALGKLSNLKLLVAGEFYTQPEKYLNQIEDLHLSDSVILSTDFIPDEQVAWYFSAADLVVQPYKSATQSGVTQIAYHYEKPMLVTRVGGLAEIVPDGIAGYVVDVDAKQIAEKIVEFYTENASERFLKGLQEGKKRYSWNTMVQTINQLTEEL